MRYRSHSLIAFFPFFVICLFFLEYLTSVLLNCDKTEKEKETILKQNFKKIYFLNCINPRFHHVRHRLELIVSSAYN